MRYVLTILFFIPILAFGQSLFVSTAKTNILYVGVDNPLKVYKCDIPCENISLKSTSDGVTVTGKNGEYIINPTLAGQVKFQVINKKDNSIIDTFSIKVQPLPDPDISFHLSPIMTLMTDYIIVHNDIWDNLKLKYKVVNFELFALRDTTRIFTIKNSGATFTPQTLNEINQLKYGDKLCIGTVWVTIESILASFTRQNCYMIK